MSADARESEELLWEGRFIAAKRRGKWEYVSRTRGVSAAVILAIDEGKVILVEQYRAALQAPCLELPAGLVGDEDEDEEAAKAAIRELEEETGYRAQKMEEIGSFHSSPGMSAEGFTLFRARGLSRVGAGGGVDGEEIKVHLVPLGEIADFVEARRADGCAVDVKLLLLLGQTLVPAGS